MPVIFTVKGEKNMDDKRLNAALTAMVNTLRELQSDVAKLQQEGDQLKQLMHAQIELVNKIQEDELQFRKDVYIWEQSVLLKTTPPKQVPWIVNGARAVWRTTKGAYNYHWDMIDKPCTVVSASAISGRCLVSFDCKPEQIINVYQSQLEQLPTDAMYPVNIPIQKKTEVSAVQSPPETTSEPVVKQEPEYIRVSETVIKRKAGRPIGSKNVNTKKKVKLL